MACQQGVSVSPNRTVSSGMCKRDRRVFELPHGGVTPGRLGPPVQSPNKPTVRDRPEQRCAAPCRAEGHSVSFSSREGRRSLGFTGPLSQHQLVLTSIRRFLMFDLSFVSKWLRGIGKGRTPKQGPRFRPRPAGGRLSLEPLEDRSLLSASFGPPVTLPVGLRPESVVTADLNGDGK